MRRFNITVNGKAYDVGVEELGAGAPAPVAAAPAPVPAASAPAPAPAAPEAAPAAAAGSIQVTSPMPGSIWEIKVSVGQQVNTGDALLILEAMKMENAIPAPSTGTVASIHVSKGDSVDTGTLLVTMN